MADPTTAPTSHGADIDVDAPLSILASEAQAEVDVQIATAKRYPRSVSQFIEDATAMATLDEETAAACFYALPRDGKSIDGPSARLAEIVASAWGNLRVEGKPVSEDDRFIRSRGVAWDLQKNVAIAFECRRRITDRKGRKYTDDMVMVTANAATSIAIRNAVFKVIPAAFWRPIYLTCRRVAVGTQRTLADRRAKMLDAFQKMGIPQDRIFATLDVGGVDDITLSHLEQLLGMYTAVKENESSIDDVFSAGHGTGRPERKTPLEKPTGYDQWLDDLTAVADEGAAALTAAWQQSALTHRQYLTATQPEVWDALKRRATAPSETTPPASPEPSAPSDPPPDLVDTLESPS